SHDNGSERSSSGIGYQGAQGTLCERKRPLPPLLSHFLS
ncbi:unnamed protein product, partial [Ectocarpus sp. 13 AM-2016]